MNWRTSRLQAALYDAGVHNPTVSRLAARVLWGYDITHLWRSLAIRPEGPTLDIPCGGGLAPPTGHHVSADLSPAMLHRARRRGARTLLQADITNLPFPSATFDTCLTYNGLHCLPDPAKAVSELARVLRPGGTLRGTTLVRGTSPRHDALFALMRRLGLFGPSGTTADLRAWLTAAGLTDITLTPSGAVTGFTARKSGTQHSRTSAKVV